MVNKAKVVIILDNGRFDEAICNMPFQIEVLETDLENVNKHTIIKEFGDRFSFYQRFQAETINAPLVNKIFKKIAKQRKKIK